MNIPPNHRVSAHPQQLHTTALMADQQQQLNNFTVSGNPPLNGGNCQSQPVNFHPLIKNSTETLDGSMVVKLLNRVDAMFDLWSSNKSNMENLEFRLSSRMDEHCEQITNRLLKVEKIMEAVSGWGSISMTEEPEGAPPTSLPQQRTNFSLYDSPPENSNNNVQGSAVLETIEERDISSSNDFSQAVVQPQTITPATTVQTPANNAQAHNVFENAGEDIYDSNSNTAVVKIECHIASENCDDNEDNGNTEVSDMKDDNNHNGSCTVNEGNGHNNAGDENSYNRRNDGIDISGHNGHNIGNEAIVRIGPNDSNDIDDDFVDVESLSPLPVAFETQIFTHGISNGAEHANRNSSSGIHFMNDALVSLDQEMGSDADDNDGAEQMQTSVVDPRESSIITSSLARLISESFRQPVRTSRRTCRQKRPNKCPRINSPSPTAYSTPSKSAAKFPETNPPKKEKEAHAVDTTAKTVHRCICGYKTNSQGSLWRHVRKEGADEPRYPCSHVGCEKRFVYPYLVRKHLIKVHKVKKVPKFLCNKCYRHFSTIKMLDTHKNERTEICRNNPRRNATNLMITARSQGANRTNSAAENGADQTGGRTRQETNNEASGLPIVITL